MPRLNSARHAPGPRPRVALVGDAVTAAYIHEISRPQAELFGPPRAPRAPRSARPLAAVRRRPGSAPSDLRRGSRRQPARRGAQIQAKLV